MGQGGSKRVDVPGVVYSDKWEVPTDFLPKKDTASSANHALFNRLPKAAERINAYGEKLAGPRVTAGPEVEPYSFWERIGGIPLTSSRFRPRQFYHPSTDFRMYTYDQMSPEERRLKAEWIARIMNPDWMQATMIYVTLSLPSVLLPAKYRMGYAMAASTTTFFAEAVIQWMDAAAERQNLDDFLVAKECWYIKNVETAQLKLVTMDPTLSNDQMSTKRALDKAEALEMQLAALEAGGMKNVEPTEKEREALSGSVPIEQALSPEGRQQWNAARGGAAVPSPAAEEALSRRRNPSIPPAYNPPKEGSQGLFSDASGRR